MKMYKRLITAVATVAALGTVAPVWAQSDVYLMARVPFQFTVGNNASLPGDTYRLSRMDAHPEMLFLRGEQTGTFVRTNETSLPRDGAAPSLVFHKYGDEYFLREVRWEGTARLDVPETKAERIAAEARRNRSASLMEKVIITAERR
jgi:hypothetical protein